MKKFKKYFSFRAGSSKPSPFRPSHLFLYILIAVLLAMGGQWVISWSEHPLTLLPGLLLFALAAAFWWAAFRGSFREGLARLPLRPDQEGALLAAIILLAACLRIFRIDQIPPGTFIDQGYQAYAALQILHKGYHPFYDDYMLMPAQTLYSLAGWLALFGPSEIASRLYFVFISIAALPFVYWSFRELAGPRMALVTLLILALMRWHLNFSRNSFLGIHILLFMFATLALLLYALRTKKRWAWVTAGLLCPAGMYNYYSYYVFPFLLLSCGAYEFWARRQGVQRQARSVGVFLLIAFLGVAPLLVHMVRSGKISARAESTSIFSNHSDQPVLSLFARNVAATALMFNRSGDPNFRHNLEEHPMLDFTCATLFVLGLFHALFRWRRRKYFYAVSGLLIMGIPGLIGTETPHAYRMLGTLPFVAFLCAAPLAAFWGLVRKRSQKRAPLLVFGALAVVLVFMARNNLYEYFVLQPRTQGDWGAYDPIPTTIGKRMLEDGNTFDYYVTNDLGRYTMLFLDYFHQDQLKDLDIPQCLAPVETAPGRGMEFDVRPSRVGVLDLLRTLYPKGTRVSLLGKDGQVKIYFYRVQPGQLASAYGLRARFSPSGPSTVLSRFPDGLPPGPWSAEMKGCLFIEKEGSWLFDARSNGRLSYWIAGEKLVPGKSLELARGYYSIRLHLTVPAGPVSLELAATGPDHPRQALGFQDLTTLPLNQGLLATYTTMDKQFHPSYVQWEPLMDFANGNDLLVQWGWGHLKWRGKIRTPEGGFYQFNVMTDPEADVRLKMDGKELKADGDGRTWSVDLKTGWHSIEIPVEKITGEHGLVFYWKRPGMQNLEVVPMAAFGETEPGY